MEFLIEVLVGVLIGLVWFLPLILALARGMKNYVAILIMCWMFWFGCWVFSPLILCWPVALIWAVAGEKA